MRETQFHREWLLSWRRFFPSCHIQKIPDTPFNPDTRFVPRKPYDFYAMLDGQFYAMELKLKTKLVPVPFEAITQGQLWNLKEAKENGALAYIVINYRESGIPEKRQKKLNLTSSRLYAVYVFDVDQFMWLDKNTTKKSASFPLIREYYDFCLSEAGKDEKRNILWDIPKLVRKDSPEVVAI